MVTDARKPARVRKVTQTVRFENLNPGMFAAYRTSVRAKSCLIGKVLNVSRLEESMVVHVYKALPSDDLRIHWTPKFVDAQDD